MAGLPPNLDITKALGSNLLQEPKKDGAQNSQQQKAKIQHTEKPKLTVRRLLRDSFNSAEMLLAVPLIANSFVMQADNISKQADKSGESGLINYVADSFGALSSVFKFAINKFIAGGQDVDDIKSNRSATLTQNVRKRFLHPNITKEFTGLLFNTRRILFNLFPNTFTVPSANHDLLDTDNKNSASGFTANLYGVLATVTGPLRFASSAFSLLTTIPSHLMGSFFTYTGNEVAYDATKYFNRVSEMFTPLLSNLSSLLSVSKSYIDSFVGRGDGKGLSKFITRGRYNVGFANMIQAWGGFTMAIPYFFGILGKARDVVFEKDEVQDYKFSKNLTTLAGYVLPSFQKSGLVSQEFSSNIKGWTEKLMKNLDSYFQNFLDTAYNANPILKNLFSKLRTTDGLGKVQAVADNFSVDSQDLSFANIKKSSFFSEVYDWLHPIQSMLMLLPNAFIASKDPYINDNSKVLGRRMDRLLGFNSMLLSLPNYILYSFSTRIPQLALKVFQYLERDHEKRNRNDVFTNFASSPGYQAYRSTINSLKKIPIVGFKYLASKLEQLNIDETTFSDDKAFNEIYESLDKDARDQESSVKASELVAASRIGFRTVLSSENKLFYAKRDPDTGLTDEENTRLGFYNAIGKFKDIAGKIPILGWVAGPLADVLRAPYKVETNVRRNILSNNGNATPNLAAAA